MNKEVWIRANRPILASEYSAVLNNTMSQRPSTDEIAIQEAGRQGLMITNFSEGQAISYQLYVPQATSKFEIRYCGYANAVCEVIVDGESVNFIDMPRNGSSTEWISASVSAAIKAGCHTITLKLFTGSCSFSSFQLK